MPVQQSLFDDQHDADLTAVVPALEIPGLTYLPEFLSDENQRALTQHVDCMPWLTDLGRRVQHYGWRYDYKSRIVSRDLRIGPLPPWLFEIATRLVTERRFERVPDQVIVNEYLPGQGIAMHVDRRCFGPAIATISLGDTWRLDLGRVGDSTRLAEQISLEPGSALLLTGEARYQWRHGIARRKRERDVMGWRPRKRRISLTFRTVLVDQHPAQDSNSDQF